MSDWTFFVHWTPCQMDCERNITENTHDSQTLHKFIWKQKVDVVTSSAATLNKFQFRLLFVRIYIFRKFFGENFQCNKLWIFQSFHRMESNWKTFELCELLPHNISWIVWYGFVNGSQIRNKFVLSLTDWLIAFLNTFFCNSQHLENWPVTSATFTTPEQWTSNQITLHINITRLLSSLMPIEAPPDFQKHRKTCSLRIFLVTYNLHIAMNAKRIARLSTEYRSEIANKIYSLPSFDLSLKKIGGRKYLSRCKVIDVQNKNETNQKTIQFLK